MKRSIVSVVIHALYGLSHGKGGLYCLFSQEKTDYNWCYEDKALHGNVTGRNCVFTVII